MRHRVGVLGTTASILLAAAVVTAGPAEARNVGGFTGKCVAPGNAVVEAHGPGLGAPCICVIDEFTGSVLLGPNGLHGPSGKCPPGTLQQP